MRVGVVLLAVVALSHVSVASAAQTAVITSPLTGSISNDQTPTFRGLAEEGGGEVTVYIYEGPTIGATAVQTLKTHVFLGGGKWVLGPTQLLKDGTYTAVATQLSPTSTSPPVTFTVDTAPPVVTLNQPESPSDNATPAFSGTTNETTPITVQIYAGGTEAGTVVSVASASDTGVNWTSGAASPALAAGEYTAVATQESGLGNPYGRSAPVTFTVVPVPPLTPAIVPPPAPPTASFKWFPTVPQVGETVSLVSNSTDAASPITALAWSLASTGPFQAGGNVLTTSFSTPGPHVVRLQATNAAGLSSVASETIDVAVRATPLMQPFPVVRIAGSYNATGVKLRLLRVQQTPAGATVTVRCKGRGCPLRSVSHVAQSTKQGVAAVEFKRLERSLNAGVILEIFVYKAGEIGKYTRFTVRRAKLPMRSDACLNPAGTQPLVCPSS